MRKCLTFPSRPSLHLPEWRITLNRGSPSLSDRHHYDQDYDHHHHDCFDLYEIYDDDYDHDSAIVVLMDEFEKVALSTIMIIMMIEMIIMTTKMIIVTIKMIIMIIMIMIMMIMTAPIHLLY